MLALRRVERVVGRNVTEHVVGAIARAHEPRPLVSDAVQEDVPQLVSQASTEKLRQQLVGAEATIRLEALDQQRLQWQQRLQAYLKERSRIEASEGLSQGDKAAAIARLEEEGFNPQERLRLQAAAELAAARKKQP